MKVLGDFNRVSDELKKKCIPKLKKGEVRKFRMLTGVENNDPDLTERAKTPMFYGAHQIRTNDRILDPFLNNGEGGYVDIGVIENFDIKSNQPTKFRLFVPGQGTGIFMLQAGRIKDEELFEYLCICNENGSFEFRDESITPLFEEINEEAEILKEEEAVDLLLAASERVKELSEEEFKKVAKRIGCDSVNPKIVAIKVKEYAVNSPKEFIKLVEEIPRRGRKPKEKELVEY